METDSNAEPAAIRVLVVDDHPAVCQGLGLLLEPEGIAVCAAAGSRSEALACVETCRPDLALVDISLGEEDGMALVAELRDRAMPTLVYSMYEDSRHVEDAFAKGACGYVTKRELHRILVQAIREVGSGSRFVSPRAALALANRAANDQEGAAVGELSRQEKEVYRYLGEGAVTKEIAAAMQISARTVESYYTRIMVKLGLEGMRELRRHAINHLRNHTP